MDKQYRRITSNGGRMEYAKVVLKRGEGRTLKAGGFWVYDNEIEKIEGVYANGGLVDVLADNGYFLGRGFINNLSKIRVRLLTRDKDTHINEEFFERRLRNAWHYRKATVDIASCRIVFGEADLLPGFIVDKYEDVLVLSSLALGIDRYKELLVWLMKKILLEDGITIRGVYERSDAKVAEQEGMERRKGFLGPEFDTKIEISENGVKYLIDVAEGQKTGFFLDQKYNRLAIRSICKGAKVLDCFTNGGSFALNAAAAGADFVVGIDYSALAVEQAGENAKRNGFTNVSFLVADVFEFLPKLLEKGDNYDVVILDPPAFTKSRNSVKAAAKGYKEINLRAMKLLKDGGFLATCSCSHFMSPDLFAETIASAAKDAKKRLRQVEFRTQSPDHPILWADDESYYLKFYIFQVCGID
jgi:23S rRNA (cytosine1962-C5)-methyltransferase